MKKSIPVEDLKFGMYVAELDRPWTDTPFMFQGFVLQSQQQLQVLMKFCKSVVVDSDRALLPELAPLAPFTPRYTTQVPVEREVAQAKAVHANTEEIMRTIATAVRANKMLDATSLEQAVRAMTESVLRNPDALMLFSQLRDKGDYAHSHALDTAVYMTSFGRFLQLPEEQISLLGYLGLMQDIGKLRVPDEILAKREPLTGMELEEARRHVQHSVDILRETAGLPPALQ